MTTEIHIKGVRDGLLIKVGDGEWPEVRAALFQRLDERADFLRGARVALDVGNHILKAAELGRLRDQFSDRGITLWAVISDSPTTQQTARDLGLATRLSKPLPDRTIRRMNTEFQDGEVAILVQRTLRSGYRIEHPGHVIVLGDVNPGAEVIAGGNVIVWGHLRGVVHAGAQGDTEAVVCALDLSPMQLRIAGTVSVTPERRGKTQPEMARLKDGRVVAEAWRPARKSKLRG